MKDLIEVYRVISSKDLNILKGHNFKSFPLRFFSNGNCTLYFNKEYATALLKSHNEKFKEKAILSKFLILRERLELMSKESNKISATIIPENLQEMNNAIIGLISCHSIE